MTKRPEQKTLATVYLHGLRWLLGEVKGQCLFLLAFPPFERQTFKELFVRSLADCRDKWNRDSSCCTLQEMHRNSLEKVIINKTSPEKFSKPWGIRMIFEVATTTQKSPFSRKKYKTQKQENMSNSQGKNFDRSHPRGSPDTGIIGQRH